MKDKIQTSLVPVMHLHGIEHGYANGYVGVPEGHPWYGKDYDHIEVDIHGGLTYSNDCLPLCKPDGLWWVGFDTVHYGDNQSNWPQSRCQDELEKLRQQAVSAVTK